MFELDGDDFKIATDSIESEFDDLRFSFECAASEARLDELAGYAADGNTPKNKKWGTPPQPPKLILEDVPLRQSAPGRFTAHIADEAAADEAECNALLYFYSEHLPIENCKIILNDESFRLVGVIPADNPLQRPMKIRFGLPTSRLPEVTLPSDDG